MNGRARNLLALVVLLGATAPGGLSAQDPVRDFDRAYARLQEATADPARAREAARCSSLFLRLEPTSPARQQRLARGVEAAVRAGRLELALELLGSADASVPARPLLRWRLHALARAGDLAPFVGCMQAAAATARDVRDEVLASEENRLGPLAIDALRAGQSELGIAVLEALAALPPIQAWRLQNLGLARRNLGELAGAERAYDRARALAPGDAQIENDYGLLLRASGRRAAALAAFRRSLELDVVAPGGARGMGPAITNLMHFEALKAGSAGEDPLPGARQALALRPDAALLRRLVLDVTLARLDR